MKTWCLLILVTGLFALTTGAQSNSVMPRLAIMVEDASVAAAADVLTAKLSERTDLQLLERAQIEKVYREQALSAGNKDYLKLGQILGADGLLVLGLITEDKNQFMTVRLIAVRPGVLLMSERFAWPVGDIAQWAAGVATYLNLFLPKLSVLVKDAVPVSTVNLRSATQSEAARELERQLTLLTIERLSRERQLFVLERRKMESLNAEQELKGRDGVSFWNGSYLLEGTIDRDGYSPETMTLNVRLVPPKGGAVKLIELRGRRDSPGDVVNELSKQLLETLKLNPSATPWNAADEAEQFSLEAKWAYRWGLLTQAQAASESAWALGKRTKEVAALRIRAYGEAVRLGDGCVEIPATPDATKIETIRRALDLFNHDTKIIFTNAQASAEWVDLGLLSLRTALGMLEGFYYAAEARPGHEEELVELRTSARETLKFLSANLSSTNQSHDCQNFGWLKWEEAGICFEKPEEPLPMYQQMLEAGYHPEHLPRVIGWSWEDRKRVPQLMKRWVEELGAATNPAVQLKGLFLGLVHAPSDAEGHLQAAENRLAGTMWEQRERVLSSVENASLIARVEEVLQRKSGPWLSPSQLFDHGVFAGLRQRLRKEYLLTANTVDFPLFEELFFQSQQIISKDEAQELAPLAEQFAQRIQAKPYIASRIRSLTESLKRQAGLAATTPETNASAATWPAEKTLLARFVRWNLKSPDGDSSRRPELQSLVVRNQRLWSQVYFLRPSEMVPFDSPPIAFVSADLESGACDVIPFPDKLGQADGFEVTEDSLFVSVQNHLERYRFRERTWERISIPMESGAQIISLNNRLYLATDESLLEVEPNSKEVKVLISTRRTPALHPMDALWKSQPRIYRRNDRSLGVTITNHFFSYELGTRNWTDHPSPQIGRKSYRMVPFYSDDGVQILLTGSPSPPYSKLYLVARWNDEAEIETLLEHNSPNNNGISYTNTNLALGVPRWDWPQPFDLEMASVVSDQKGLWCLNPRKVWGMPGVFEEPIKFGDDRQATLLHFEREFRQPLSVPIRFESNAQEIEPFDPMRGKFPMLWDRVRNSHDEIPFWRNTPQHLVFSEPALGGHWLIFKNSLEVKLQEQRAVSRRKNSSETRSTTEAARDLKQ